jgi:predicted alpha/beta-hydrolase family hydrolase
MVDTPTIHRATKAAVRRHSNAGRKSDATQGWDLRRAPQTIGLDEGVLVVSGAVAGVAIRPLVRRAAPTHGRGGGRAARTEFALMRRPRVPRRLPPSALPAKGSDATRVLSDPDLGSSAAHGYQPEEA